MYRRTILCLSALATLGLALLPGSAISQTKSLKEQLIGAWTLASLETVTPDGKKHENFGANPNGIIIFDASGYFSQTQVQSSRPKFKSVTLREATADERKVVTDGSLTHFGTWSVNEADNTIRMHIEGSLVPNEEGTDTKRLISTITADELKFSNPAGANGGRNDSAYRRAK